MAVEQATDDFVLKIATSLEERPPTEVQVTPTLAECRSDVVETCVSNRFVIEKSQCWPFSKTIRVDVRPVCLLVNRTRYRIEMYERAVGADGEETGLLHQVVEENGRASLSEIASVSQYRFSISLDEYSVEDPYNLTRQGKLFGT